MDTQCFASSSLNHFSLEPDVSSSPCLSLLLFIRECPCKWISKRSKCLCLKWNLCVAHRIPQVHFDGSIFPLLLPLCKPLSPRDCLILILTSVQSCQIKATAPLSHFAFCVFLSIFCLASLAFQYRNCAVSIRSVFCHLALKLIPSLSDTARFPGKMPS